MDGGIVLADVGVCLYQLEEEEEEEMMMTMMIL